MRGKEKAYEETRQGFNCFYNTDLRIGWILYEGSILIYNNDNVFFDIKLPSRLHNIHANQVYVINNENGTFLFIVHGQTAYSRVVNENKDLSYTSCEITSLDKDETVAVSHMMKSPAETFPSLVIATSKGKFINTQVHIDEGTLNLQEIVLQAPKKFMSSITTFFSGSDIEETDFHQIYFDLRDWGSIYLCLDSFKRWS